MNKIILQVDVVPLVVGQWSVREEVWLETLDLWDREGGWEKDHRQTGSYPPV
jgi:hypothetical protein